MKILVCGDRDWFDRILLERALDNFFTLFYWGDDFLLIEGDCRGADRMSKEWAKKRGYNYKDMPADWDKYGTKAGPIRNREMLDLKPGLVIAFHSSLSKSKGTLDTVMEANRRGIQVIIIPSTDDIPKTS